MRHGKLIGGIVFLFVSMIFVGTQVSKQRSAQPQPEVTEEPSEQNLAEEKTIDQNSPEQKAPEQKPEPVVSLAPNAGAPDSLNSNSSKAPAIQEVPSPNKVAASANRPTAPAPAPIVPVPEEKPESNCFAHEYQHKASAKQKDIEDFLDFTNAFPIAHENYNPTSICVKVNKQTTPFKVVKGKEASEILIGSVVGPETIIRVSYCIGKANCKEPCAAPQKRFMDDLMSEASDGDEFGDAWGGSGNSAEKKKKLNAQVKEFRSVASENQSLTKQSVMRDWTTLSQNETVCKISK